MDASYVERDSPLDPLNLEELRNILIRQEETIIFSLIERAQFALNRTVYQAGGVFNPGVNDQRLSNLSFLEYFFVETERVHALARRYTSPDENPFFPQALVKPMLPLIKYPQYIKPNGININSQIMEIYINKILPAIVTNMEDQSEWYGSTATTDIAVLQAISKRVHMGKHVAEVKFQGPQKEEFIKAIRARDREELWELITHQEVEDKLLKRIFLKASTYGQDIETPAADPSTLGSQTYKVSPAVIMEIYKDFIITLTKEVQIQYLFQRLDGVEVSFVGPVGSVASLAVFHFFGAFEGVNTLPESSIESVFQSVLTGNSVFGIVPYHNILGQIRETTTLLITSPVKVYGEVTVPVKYHLFGSSNASLETIEKVYGHPLAFQQCQTWLGKYLPVQLITTTSPIHGDGPEFSLDEHLHSAFIASTPIGQMPNLKAIAKNIQDNTGNDVTLVLFEVNHHPGSLSSALATFGRHNVSLLSIESRPVLPEEHRQGQDRIFRFLVELVGHAEDENVKSALSALEEHANNISIIGSFQRGKVISNEWDP